MKALLALLVACSPASAMTQLQTEALRYVVEQQRPVCAFPDNAAQFGPGVEETRATWARKCAP